LLFYGIRQTVPLRAAPAVGGVRRCGPRHQGWRWWRSSRFCLALL